MIKGGGGNTAAFITAKGVVVVDTKTPAGASHPRQDQRADRQAGHHDHQHPHARRSRRRQREFSAERRDRRPRRTPRRTWRRWRRQVRTATPNVFRSTARSPKDLQGQADARHGRGPDRPLLLRPRPHQRRRVRGVSGARVMHAGDIFARKGTPLLDTNNGGSGVAYPETLAKAAAGIKDVETVITGHSAVMTWADLKEFSEFNQDSWLGAGRREGGQDRRGRRRRIQAAREVPGLHEQSGPREAERGRHLRRAQEMIDGVGQGRAFRPSLAPVTAQHDELWRGLGWSGRSLSPSGSPHESRRPRRRRYRTGAR